MWVYQSCRIWGVFLCLGCGGVAGECLDTGSGRLV